ncbi:MAG: hypothetical protein JWL90_4590 [Chthoniobacteraceae bacterium]|nr:hypothetical protein [Chthoniobacteraceae bacterium]
MASAAGSKPDIKTTMGLAIAHWWLGSKANAIEAWKRPARNWEVNMLLSLDWPEQEALEPFYSRSLARMLSTS